MKKIVCIVVYLFIIPIGVSQNNVVFEVISIPLEGSSYVGLRGDTPPLSWEKTIFLSKNGDIFSTMLEFSEDVKKIEYKFVLDNGKEIQWESTANRSEFVNNEKQKFLSTWNVEKLIDPKTLSKLTVDQLMEDYHIISNTILKVHPGLFKFNDSLTIKQNLDVLKNDFSNPLTYAETFLAMSKFIATIQCDHTLVSAYNQEAIINSLIHQQHDKVPFAFDWIEKKMIITHNASESKELEPGSEVVSINSIPVSNILTTLLPYITADGSTLHNKITKAQVDGYSFRYNAFDVLYPLLFPVKNGELSLIVKKRNQDSATSLVLKSISRKKRSEILTQRDLNFPKTPEDLWEFKILKNNIGYLKIGSFATDEFKKNWKVMLSDAFKEMKNKKVESLILDIRENQGGLDDASYELEKYIYQKNMITDGLISQSRFLEFPEEVKPHIQTWDYWFYNLKDEEYIKNEIYYAFPRNLTKKKIKPSKTTFKGQIYMLTSAKNVSGAFYLARLFKKNKGGTLIGQETGGNQKGINGGSILFFKPPNSRININLPVIGTFSTEMKPDKGIKPDVVVDKTVDTSIRNVDVELNKALDLILRKN